MSALPTKPALRAVLSGYLSGVAGITMYDTALNNQFPPGAQAYAAYVDGSVGDQPNYAYIVRTFPGAQHLSIALFAGDNADALDVEPGAAAPSDVPAWYARQKQRGIQRPCVYASASTMAGSILPVLRQAGISRPAVRLWSAHYGLGEHICGPASCGAVPVEVDGTQWTSSALGRVLDQSLLQADFFTTDTAVTTEAELQSGQLNLGRNALTVISVPPGTAHHIAFGCDNGVQGQPPARLRVAIFDTAWHVENDIPVDGTKGLRIVPFPDPAKTGVISVIRQDAGKIPVGYVVY
jgi:hypothetical protein